MRREKAPRELMAVQEAAVGVTKRIILLLAAIALPLKAAVLPDERADTLYHTYDGGGIQVSGPSVLVRKNIGKSVSVSANYYVDMVSSASIDIYSQASKDCNKACYKEERKQQSVGIDYMHDRTNLSLNFTTSDENDYQAETYNFGVSQAFFGDLTTLSFGFGFGQDTVGKNKKVAGSLFGIPDPDFRKMDKEQRRYSLNLSQILTKNLIAETSFESGSEACVELKPGESCLNNPYRSYSFVQNGARILAPEKYPLTHNTDAAALRAIYHLPYSAAIRLEARQFSDSWGITASNAEIRYIHDFKKDLVLELKYRIYNQTAADFYSDLFPYRDAQNFMARDKELSPYSSTTFGLGLTYRFPWSLPGVDKSTANLYWDHMQINYDDFRDYANFTKSNLPDEGYSLGNEPLYSLDADVIRFYLSFWF
jgi:hypothetical protein